MLFLRLPSEIRNVVYAHVLSEPVIYCHTYIEVKKSPLPAFSARTQIHSVSRQIHQENGMMEFTLNICYSKDVTPGCLFKGYLRKPNPLERGMIVHIQVLFTDYENIDYSHGTRHMDLDRSKVSWRFPESPNLEMIMVDFYSDWRFPTLEFSECPNDKHNERVDRWPWDSEKLHTEGSLEEKMKELNPGINVASRRIRL